MSSSSDPDRRRFPGLEILLTLSMILLLGQLFPAAASELLWAADIRHWSPNAFLIAGLIFVLIMACIRFGPDMIDSQRMKADRRNRQQAQMEKNRLALEARQRRQDIEDGRKRIIY